ncbi:rhodanese-like domain-containing protein [Paucibacter sp. APW11]|uniref:Rhodanese-like domain-containing protein n=1 Tax=Roseateles aquae TaxID=3077235 RepID=A0ABU3P8W9_9BURK|nr:rhodanese-like domain-containing protein [Paucibacter sp. APW11]MDT8998999.1 rhodanese-like domain-containing protein [Paucibacter sp. APW11]
MKQLAVQDLQGLARQNEALLLLDIREPWEAALASIHIDGLASKLIPMGQLVARLPELDPAQPVVCYCHHGMRSQQVVAFLERQGFELVYNLAGGIDAWSCEQDPSVPRY